MEKAPSLHFFRAESPLAGYARMIPLVLVMRHSIENCLKWWTNHKSRYFKAWHAMPSTGKCATGVKRMKICKGAMHAKRESIESKLTFVPDKSKSHRESKNELHGSFLWLSASVGQTRENSITLERNLRTFKFHSSVPHKSSGQTGEPKF